MATYVMENEGGDVEVTLWNLKRPRSRAFINPEPSFTPSENPTGSELFQSNGSSEEKPGVQLGIDRCSRGFPSTTIPDRRYSEVR